jgi:hypothetical protein
MKLNDSNLALWILALATLSLTSCSTASRDEHRSSSKSPPEAMLITYHVKAGKERELEQVLARAWELYRKEKLVFVQPHVIVRAKESAGAARLVEVFTWVSGDIPENAPHSVRALWDEMQALCEPRGGKSGVEGGEVELVSPRL